MSTVPSSRIDSYACHFLSVCINAPLPRNNIRDEKKKSVFMQLPKVWASPCSKGTLASLERKCTFSQLSRDHNVALQITFKVPYLTHLPQPSSTVNRINDSQSIFTFVLVLTGSDLHHSAYCLDLPFIFIHSFNNHQKFYDVYHLHSSELTFIVLREARRKKKDMIIKIIKH